ncbi:hypothetical protein KJ918_04245 [Patescibacteria group bacterium]|nr:hypothetical protein [Patescibacteria group bacterium]
MKEESFSPTLTEKLTTNFYLWETRGRGWQVWDCPVELEPPYEPFFHYMPQLPLQKVIDDGRKHTFLSSLTERFLKSLKGPPETQVTPAVDQDIYYDLEPLPFTDTSDIKEIRISLPPKEKIGIEHAEQFLLNLSYCSSPLSFEVIGTSDSIIVQLTCRESDLLQVRQQIQAYFPEAAISEESNFLRNIWDIEAETGLTPKS